MVLRLMKLPFKLARLPLRVARFALKTIFAGGESGAAPSGSGPTPTPGAGAAGSAGSTASEPGPSPFDMQVDPALILSRMEGGESLVFIDVRQAQELAATGVVEGAIHIPSQDLPRRMEDLDKESELVVYCAAGARSLDAVMFLREKGFDNAWSLGGGLPRWESEGGALVPA